MDLIQFNQAATAMDALQHQEMLQDISSFSFVHMEKNNRAKRHREIYSRAYPALSDGSRNVISMEEAAKILKAKLNGR